MCSSTYNENTLPDLLPLYYNRIFPHAAFHKWLCYGEPKNFSKREISFTLYGDIYLRYQAFDTAEEFAQALHKRYPIKIDIGAVYSQSLVGNSTGPKVAMEREVVFDIDMTDYDEIRTCCSGANICTKCWRLMNIACKILDTSLRVDFGFEHILWVFSGRRGIHCWIGDKRARRLDDNERATVAEYFNIIKGGVQSRKVRLPYHIHSVLKRALKIIDQYFENTFIVEQDILGTNERLVSFLSNIEEDIRPLFSEPMSKVTTSSERWTVFQNTFQKLFKEQKLHKSLRHMVEEIKLYYAFPRLDLNVTKARNHLLKAPFCVHPKTGKISVPIKAKTIDNFYPDDVPTINQLLEEIDAYHAKAKEQELKLTETSSPIPVSKIQDFKKTSLFKYVAIFNEFLRGLQSAAVKEREQNGTTY